MRNAKRTQTCLQHSPRRCCTPTPNFLLLLDVASHWGVVGRHQLPFPIPCSASNGWQQRLTFPLLFAFSLFDESQVQVFAPVPHLKLAEAWCVPQSPLPRLSISQLGPVSHLCCTTGHGGPRGGHNHTLAYSPVMVVYIEPMATTPIQSTSMQLMCQRQQGKENGSACRPSTLWLHGILRSSFGSPP